MCPPSQAFRSPKQRVLLAVMPRQRQSRTAHAWPTTALALVDGQSKALGLAVRVGQNPAELPLAMAELLDAQVVLDSDPTAAADTPHGAGETVLHVPTPGRAPYVLSRPEEAFTPAETARAVRLAELAGLVAAGRTPEPPLQS